MVSCRKSASRGRPGGGHHPRRAPSPPLRSHRRAGHRPMSPCCAQIGDRPRLGTTPAQPMSEEAVMSELDRLETAVAECREMIREAHAATKDLRAAVRDAKREVQDLAKDEVAAQVQHEVSRQLEELGEQTSAAITAATQKVVAEFDRFGEALLGKETYWQTASGRRSATRP